MPIANRLGICTCSPVFLSVTAQIAKDDNEWVLLTMQTDDEEEDGVAFQPEFVCPECGHQASDCCDGRSISESESKKITLKLKIEELPRFVVVLNEMYRAITSKLMVLPEFDRLQDWDPREWREGRWLIIDPIRSRREPESRIEDFKERIAILRAFEIISARLSEDSQKVGLWPIGCQTKNGSSRLCVTSRLSFILAATYVPTQLPVQYHRPCGA